MQHYSVIQSRKTIRSVHLYAVLAENNFKTEWYLETSLAQPLHNGLFRDPCFQFVSNPKAATTTECHRIVNKIGSRPSISSAKSKERSFRASESWSLPAPGLKWRNNKDAEKQLYIVEPRRNSAIPGSWYSNIQGSPLCCQRLLRE